MHNLRCPQADPSAGQSADPLSGLLSDGWVFTFRAGTLLNVSMKWLTREWASGAFDDSEWDSQWREYQLHCTAVLPRLRDGAERLVHGINLHDGQIQSFEYRPDGALAVRVLVGDLQVGYEFVELSFVDAELRIEHGATIDSLRFQDAETEILYDEVDVEADGRFVHRVLLWPQGEYEVVFTALTERREEARSSDRRQRGTGDVSAEGSTIGRHAMGGE